MLTDAGDRPGTLPLQGSEGPQRLAFAIVQQADVSVLRRGLLVSGMAFWTIHETGQKYQVSANY